MCNLVTHGDSLKIFRFYFPSCPNSSVAMLLSSFPAFKVTGEGRRQRRAWVVRLRTSFFIQSERFTQFLFLTTVFSCLGFHRHNKRWGEKEREKGLRVILRHSSVKPLHRTTTGRVGGSGSAGSLIGARLLASTSPGGQSSADHYLSDTRQWKEKRSENHIFADNVPAWSVEVGNPV